MPEDESDPLCQFPPESTHATIARAPAFPDENALDLFPSEHPELDDRPRSRESTATSAGEAFGGYPAVSVTVALIPIVLLLAAIYFALR